MWYLQFHFVCAKLLLSIWIASFDFVCSGWRTCCYSITGGFFLPISRTFPAHPHSEWSSFYDSKNRRPD